MSASSIWVRNIYTCYICYIQKAKSLGNAGISLMMLIVSLFQVTRQLPKLLSEFLMSRRLSLFFFLCIYFLHYLKEKSKIEWMILLREKGSLISKSDP